MKYLDNFLRVVAIFLLVVSGWVYHQETPVWKLFLVKDFNSLDLSMLLIKDQNDLGLISELKGSGLKRRTVNEGIFNSLRVQDTVFGGDIITTDHSTMAVIKFNDGSVLEIQPGSMVKLDFYMDKSGLLKIAKNPKVEVLSGVVTGTGGTQALTMSNGQGQNLTVAAHATNTVQAPVKNKPVTRINANQLSKLNLPVAEEVVPNAPGLVKESMVPKPVAPVLNPVAASPAVVAPTAPKAEVIPKAPRKVASIPPKSVILATLDVEPSKIAGLKGLNSNLYQGEDIRTFFVDLKWEEVPAATGYKLEFFLDSGLTNPWFQVETGNNYYKLTQMFSGSIFYQVTALHNQKVIGKTKPQPLSFNYQGPELKNPKSGTQLEAAEGFYYFTWEKTNFTDKYVLEVSKDPQFNKIVKKEVTANFVQMPLLSGVYYWRVSSKLGDVVSKPSKVNTLVIK